MQWFFDILRQKFIVLTSREPGIRFGGALGEGGGDRDWLPPVMGQGMGQGLGLGLGDWPQGLMAGMADGNGTWYFDKR